jgi:DNA-binding response OmpR family regulator
LTPLKILVVDDDANTLRALTRLCVLAGHEARAAATSAEARRLAAESPPDVLVSELELPDGSGVDLVRQLRLIAPAVCAIAVSAHSAESCEGLCRAAGFKQLLRKPVAFGEVLAAINSCRPSPVPVRSPRFATV